MIRVFTLSAFLILGLIACSDDPPVPTMDMGPEDTNLPDAQHDISPDLDMSEVPVDPNNPGLARTPEQPGVSSEIPAPTSVAPGEARVGRVVGESGFRGLWAHCRVGDFRLVNAVIDVCIQAESTNRNEVFTGGMIVDAKRAGSDADDILDMLKPRIGFNVHYAERVEIVRDGTLGGPAVLRVEGRDMPIAYLLGVLGGRFLSTAGLRVTTEYRIYPDASDIEILTWVYNPNDVRRVVTPGDWLAVGDRSNVFWSSTGTTPTNNTEFDWVGTFGPGASFGWTRGEVIRQFPIPVSNSPFIIFESETENLQPDEEVVLRRWFAVGDGSLESVRLTLLARLDTNFEELREQTITLSPPSVRTIELSSESGPVSFGITDEQGRVTFQVLPGSYTAKVEASIGEEPTEYAVELISGDATIVIPESIPLHVDVLDSQGPGIALIKISGGQTNTRHEKFSMPVGMGQGRATFQVVPGTYQIIVTRGLEYEVETMTVEVNEETTETATLRRSVETPGWIGADFHQHMEPSTDSEIHVWDRIIDNIAEGVEFVVSTDHDVVTDLKPYLIELGLEEHLGTVAGMEVSPTIGHVNVYPAEHDRLKRGNGTIELAYMEAEEVQIRTIPDIFAAARAMAHDPVVQLNHPRGSSSLFETANYAPDIDPRTHNHREWSTNFDTLEIINRVGSTCALMADWATFLNVGLRRTGLGNSDSHNLRGDPAGSPRNFLPINATPGEIQVEDVVAALKSGQVTVGSHAFLDLGDVLPGDTLTLQNGEPARIRVRVQTPSWSQATRLYVIVNGSVIQDFDRTETNGFDFDDEIEIPASIDSWVVFFAVGPRPQVSDYGNPTIAFSNPVFLDVGGDGWTSPVESMGDLPAVDLSAINNPSFCD